MVGLEATPHVFAIAGATFDCLIVPLLLWRRTRFPAWLVLVAFHVCTWALFPIGVFPWLMIGASTVFFEPDWPRRLLARRRSTGGSAARRAPVSRSPLLPVLALAWVVVQLALPLRHLAYPGDHRWTGEGYRFSWNVLLVEKAGSVTFLVHEPSTGRTWVADPTRLYTRTQLRVDEQRARPHPPGADRHRRRPSDVAATTSRSGSTPSSASTAAPPSASSIPTVDLAAEPRDPWPDDWILPAPE